MDACSSTLSCDEGSLRAASYFPHSDRNADAMWHSESLCRSLSASDLQCAETGTSTIFGEGGSRNSSVSRFPCIQQGTHTTNRHGFLGADVMAHSVGFSGADVTAHSVVDVHDGGEESSSGWHEKMDGDKGGEKARRASFTSNASTRRSSFSSNCSSTKCRLKNKKKLQPLTIMLDLPASDSLPVAEPNRKIARCSDPLSMSTLWWFLARRGDDVLRVKEAESFPELDECSALLRAMQFRKGSYRAGEELLTEREGFSLSKGDSYPEMGEFAHQLEAGEAFFMRAGERRKRSRAGVPLGHSCDDACLYDGPSSNNHSPATARRNDCDHSVSVGGRFFGDRAPEDGSLQTSAIAAEGTTELLLTRIVETL